MRDGYAEPMSERPEVYVSVDIEAAGPTPRSYSMLSIGACRVDDPDNGFYVELKPDSELVDDAALAVSGLSMERLEAEGVDPAEAMQRFDDWLTASIPATHRAVFTAFNAPFDWMFVDDYFRRYLGRNPFGASALDVKAYYMGQAGVNWAHTSMRHLSPLFLSGRQLTHNALADARDQAELFRALRSKAEQASPSPDGWGERA
jgi:DNA polymerase III epsilon subunit-like protein